VIKLDTKLKRNEKGLDSKKPYSKIICRHMERFTFKSIAKQMYVYYTYNDFRILKIIPKLIRKLKVNQFIFYLRFVESLIPRI
jgi:hypothetical protein